MQICNECGKSVAWGSGLFVNRIRDLNTKEERMEMGKPHPEGDFICVECESKIRLEEIKTLARQIDERPDLGA